MRRRSEAHAQQHNAAEILRRFRAAGFASIASSRLGGRTPDHDSDDEAPDVVEAPVTASGLGINLGQLKLLRAMFERADKDSGGTLDETEFIAAFTPILGTFMSEEDLRHWFLRIDANANGRIDWDEFSTYILLETETMENGELAPTEYVRGVNAHSGEHKQRISTLLMHPRNGRYYTTSRDGTIAMWNASSLALMEMPPARTACWITGACFANSSGSKFLTCSTDKTICLYDSQSLALLKLYAGKQSVVVEPPVANFQPAKPKEPPPLQNHRSVITAAEKLGFDDFCTAIRSRRPVREEINLQRRVGTMQLRDLADIPQTMAFYPNDTGGDGVVLVGLRNGHLRIYDFSRPEPITARDRHALHGDRITQLRTSQYMRAVISCSWDATLKMLNLDTGKVFCTLSYPNDSPFGIAPGGQAKAITSFDWAENLRLVVSTGFERFVHLWNPFIPKPIHRLDTKTSTAIDAVFNEQGQQLITLQRDGTLRVWDVRNYRCLQTLHDGAGQTDALQAFLAFDHGRQRILTATTCLSSWPMSSSYSSDDLPVVAPGSSGHHEPVVQAVFNPTFNQVISVDRHAVFVWDITTGAKVVSFRAVAPELPNAQITSVTLDDSGRRLITGTDGGVVSVWNYVSGQMLKLCTADRGTNDGIAEIPTVAHICKETQNFKFLFGTTDNNLWAWEDSDAFLERSEPAFEVSNKAHILSMAYVPPSYLALGSDTNQITFYNLFSKSEAGTLGRKVDHLAIDTLLFLKHTYCLLAAGRSDGSILLWNTTSKELMCAFKSNPHGYATLCLASDQLNQWLIAGDEQGHVSVACLADIPLTARSIGTDTITMQSFFKAHNSSVSSVCYVDKSELILTTSADCQVKLFTMEGDLVGVFGQERPWRIGDSRTYALDALPCTPMASATALGSPIMSGYVGTDEHSACSVPILLRRSLQREATTEETGETAGARLFRRNSSNGLFPRRNRVVDKRRPSVAVNFSRAKQLVRLASENPGESPSLPPMTSLPRVPTLTLEHVHRGGDHGHEPGRHTERARHIDLETYKMTLPPLHAHTARQTSTAKF